MLYNTISVKIKIYKILLFKSRKIFVGFKFEAHRALPNFRPVGSKKPKPEALRPEHQYTTQIKILGISSFQSGRSFSTLSFGARPLNR
jgi:hypothetical protein